MIEDILAELGVTVDPAKAAVVAKWNTTLATTQSEAATTLAAAQKQFEDAQALQRVIDSNINAAGLTETKMAELEANYAAAKAQLESIRAKGFAGIDIPALPVSAAKDPVAELTGLITKGFTTMGQTMNEMNRYQRITGSALPEDPATIADRAASARLSVHDYMEQTYKLTEKETAKATAEATKREADMKAKWEEEYKAAHPVTTGHPELGPGVPSNYPNIPKPSDAAGVREMSGKSPMEKIRMARDRVSKEVQTRMNAA